MSPLHVITFHMHMSHDVISIFSIFSIVIAQFLAQFLTKLDQPGKFPTSLPSFVANLLLITIKAY